MQCTLLLRYGCFGADRLSRNVYKHMPTDTEHRLGIAKIIICSYRCVPNWGQYRAPIFKFEVCGDRSCLSGIRASVWSVAIFKWLSFLLRAVRAFCIMNHTANMTGSVPAIDELLCSYLLVSWLLHCTNCSTRVFGEQSAKWGTRMCTTKRNLVTQLQINRFEDQFRNGSKH
jgi:hypothetical protein